jgi:hypothetical protein
MPTNALAEILPSRDCSQTEKLARKWVVTFAELFCVSLEDRGTRFVELWVSSLVDLEPGTLDAACWRAMQTCKFFPTPAEIRAPIQVVEQADFEDEWQALLDYCREWVHPDVCFRGAPELPTEIDHAARAAGGVHFIRACSREELGWRKKAFIEDLQRSRKTGDLAGLLTGGQLRKLLRKACSPVALLPDSVPYTPAVAATRASLESAGETLAGVASPRPELRRTVDREGRLRELQRQAEEIKAKYGAPASAKNPSAEVAASR